MLLRMGFSNFKSFFEYQELSLVASEALKDTRSFMMPAGETTFKALPCTAIYGANASGKSNALEALHYFKWFVGNSQSANSERRGIVRPYFRLSPEGKSAPTTIDVDFVMDNTHYHYGFSINDEIIEQEWLYQFNYGKKRSRVVLMHRFRTDESTDTSEYAFSKTLKGKHRSIIDLTRDNALFLSSAAQNNHALFSKIFEYFKKGYKFRFQNNINEPMIAKRIEDDALRQKVRDIIATFDTGVKEIRTQQRKVDGKEIEIIKAINSVFEANDIANRRNIEEIVADSREVRFVHESSDGSEILFKLQDESLGTQSMLGLMSLVILTLESGGVLFIDEIETSLHTLVTREIVTLFNNEEANPNGAQLIFSTHETNLLCCGVLRRDQIWFSERCADSSTEIYPLTDFKIRKESDVENGYLEGRFGAIPFMGDINEALGI